jgi:hypothetical protein
LSAFGLVPELEQSKAAVLNTLASVHSRRSYAFAIGRFIAWYCSEPRLTFNRAVVVHYDFPDSPDHSQSMARQGNCNRTSPDSATYLGYRTWPKRRVRIRLRRTISESGKVDLLTMQPSNSAFEIS